MNKRKLTIGVIGGGNMGEAIITGIRRSYKVRVSEKNARRRGHLKRKYRVSVVEIPDLARSSDIILLAVKPQDFEKILGDIKGHVRKRHLIISIAAGITTKYIEKHLGNQVRVVRTMPNLGVKVGKGMTGIARGKYATASDLRIANGIFRNVGQVLEVSENKLDAITAVSGSGPAYYFNFIEEFTNSAKRLGLSDQEAFSCVNATLAGSNALYDVSDQDAATLKKQVTSKGGTTEAALRIFKKKSFAKIFLEALKAAKKRSKELSQ